MLTNEQLILAQAFLQGAIQEGIRDELSCMIENDYTGLFDDVSHDDFFVELNIKVYDVSKN